MKPSFSISRTMLSSTMSSTVSLLAGLAHYKLQMTNSKCRIPNNLESGICNLESPNAIAWQKPFHAGECIHVDGEFREGKSDWILVIDHVVLLSFARIIERLFPVLRKSGDELLSQADLRWHRGCNTSWSVWGIFALSLI